MLYAVQLVDKASVEGVSLAQAAVDPKSSFVSARDMSEVARLNLQSLNRAYGFSGSLCFRML